jgi:CheY-like chemotaxis protein
MPRLAGIDLLRWLKTQPELRDIPVIIETGLSHPDQIREGIEAGAFYYLSKPFDRNLLSSVVSTALVDFHEHRSLMKRLRESENPFRGLLEGTFRFKSLDEGEHLSVWIANCCPDPEKVAGINELFANAVEHGNLGITYEEKTTFVDAGTWLQEVQRRLTLPENAEKYVVVTIRHVPDALIVEIEDQGNGFDFGKYLHFDESRVFDNHGRGIAIARVSLGLEYLKGGKLVRVTVPFG